MVAPIWLQIKKKITVPTNNEMARYSERSDWKTMTELQYEDTKKIFSVLGAGPIRTASEFVFLVRENFGQGNYMCMARTEKGARFWLFLKFICNNVDYKIEPTYVSFKKRKGRVISNQECARLMKRVNLSTSSDERKFYEQELAFEEQKLKEQTDNRRGAYPYLINSPPTGKIYSMEDYRNKEREAIEQQQEKENNSNDEMFKKWDKNYFDGVEDNDLDRNKTIQEQQPQDEEVVDGMSVW
jgi:hypothetical protein